MREVKNIVALLTVLLIWSLPLLAFHLFLAELITLFTAFLPSRKYALFLLFSLPVILLLSRSPLKRMGIPLDTIYAGWAVVLLGNALYFTVEYFPSYLQISEKNWTNTTFKPRDFYGLLGFIKFQITNWIPLTLKAVTAYLAIGCILKTNIWSVGKKIFDISINAGKFKISGSGIHGTGKLEKINTLKNKFRITSKSLIIGLNKNGDYLGYNGDSHLFVYAAPRTGKGTTSIIPNLLMVTNRSFVVLDPNGENYTITANARRAAGRKVVKIDPTNITNSPFSSDGFDPLSILDIKDEISFDSYASMLANILAGTMDKKNQSKDENTFFVDNARLLITIILKWTFASPTISGARDITKFRDLISLPEPSLLKLLTEIYESKNVLDGELVVPAGSLLGINAKTISSIASTAKTWFEFLGQRHLRKCLTKSSFDIDEFIEGNVDLYLCIDSTTLSTFPNFCEMILTCLIHSCYKNAIKIKHNPVFMLDEIHLLGKQQTLIDALEFGPGKGVTIMGYIHNLPQLRDIHGDNGAKRFLNSAGIIQIFGVPFSDAREWEDNLGKMTIEKSSETKSTSSQHKSNELDESSASYSESETTSEIGRPIITRDEINKLGSHEQIIIVDNKDCCFAKRSPYFEDPFCAGKYDRNPSPKIDTFQDVTPPPEYVLDILDELVNTAKT